MNSFSDAKNRREVLGKAPIPSLMVKFAIPSIVAMLVSAFYNIADQIFIGRSVGTLGNAATNIAFPLAMSCTAIGLLFGIGAAANFNLHMGRKEYDRAPFYIGNAVSMILICGSLLCILTELFLRPMLIGFGSPSDVLPYAMEYVRITALGFPFLILTIGGGHIIRADGSPTMAMICSMIGAITNVLLDALFVFGFHLGMAGAAWATILGQFLSGGLVIRYVLRYKTVALERQHFLPQAEIVREDASLGVASCVNQLAMMVVQIVLNNSLKYYGLLSVYGDAIPIACAGIVSKVNQIVFSIVIGIAQGSQPIESFNYGARNYQRVKDTYMLAIKAAGIVSVTGFLIFQLFPARILSLFGKGSPEYYKFGVRFFRIFLFFTWANCIQPATSQFFASVGKPKKGMFVSLTRQILFLLPVILILPRFIGIDGILFAGPVSDCMAAIVAARMVRGEFLDLTNTHGQARGVV